MGDCCEQVEWRCCMFRATTVSGACALLSKCHRHRSMHQGLMLCIWPHIPTDHAAQVYSCPSESGQLAKSSTGGMLCLPAITTAHTHVPGWRGVPTVKSELRALQAAKSVGSCWEVVGKLWHVPRGPVMRTMQSWCNEPVFHHRLDLFIPGLLLCAGAAQVGYAQPCGALEGANTVSVPAVWGE